MTSLLARPAARRLPFALLLLLAAFPAAPAARAQPGTLVENVQLRSHTGAREWLLSPTAKANVIVFFRTSQERSLDTLKQLAACEHDLAGKSVHWAAVVSGSATPAEVKDIVEESTIKMPVLFDDGDALYEKLDVRMHPMIGVLDDKFKLMALDPYRQIGYCDVVVARIRRLLGEIDDAALRAALEPPRSDLPGADPMKKAMRDVNYARHLVGVGAHADAVRFAQRALVIAPVSQAYTVMGIAYARQGNCGEAAKAFEKALKLDPKDAEAARERAACRR